ncbi:MAG TPA: class I SAM-dependent methyltransferase [Armatimonadota bacterium]
MQEWDAKYEKCPGFFGEDPNPLTEEFARLVRVRMTLNMVLDLGCGPGRDSLYLAAQGLEVTAMDASERAIELLQAKLEDSDLLTLCQPVRADATEGLPFSDDFFQGIFAYLFLNTEMSEADLGYVLREIHRSLEPGGLFVGSVRSATDSECGQGEQLGPDMYRPGSIAVRFFTEESLRDWLQDFEIERLEPKQVPIGGHTFDVLEFIATKAE